MLSDAWRLPRGKWIGSFFASFAALSLTLAGSALAAAPAPTETAFIWKLSDPFPLGAEHVSRLGQPTAASGSVKSLRFDGAKDGLVVDQNLLEGASQFTLELLIKPDGTGPEEQRFFHAALTPAADHRVLVELRLDSKTRQWSLDTHLRRDPDEKLTLLDRALVHSADAWHWVALTYDGKTMQSFVDGKAELKGNIAFPPMKGGSTSLGVRLNKLFWYKGEIAEVRVHSRALPAEELQQRKE